MIDLRLGDCLEVMPSIPSGSVDMILADLPYGTTACKWDTIIPLEPLWREYKRIIKRNGAIVLTASQPFTSALVMSNPTMFRYEWVWHKVRVTGFLNSRKQPLRSCESVLVFYQAQPMYNPQFRRGEPIKRTHQVKNIEGVWGKVARIGRDSDDTRLPTTLLTIPDGHSPTRTTAHPTQKPVALMEYLIRTYTNEGETVLDNTMGSGTTGVACINTGRNFIGIERDAGYFQIATERIHKAQEAGKQLEMAV